MNWTINHVEIYISMVALMFSILAYVNHRKTRKLAEKTYDIAISTKHATEIESLKMMPQLDIIGLVSVDDVERVVILIANMRSTPFRINCVGVERYAPKPRTIKNLLRSKLESNFDWDYESIDSYRWNPKGNLDFGEKYQCEAAEFLTVKDQEKILITIPDFNEYRKYLFNIKTSHGNVSIADRISKNGKVHFCNDFRQSFS